MDYHKIFVDGQWIEHKTGDWIEVENPVTREIIDKVPACGEAEVELAVRAAEGAFESWKNLDLEERISYVKDFQKNLKEMRDEIMHVLRSELGVNEAYAAKSHIDGHIVNIDEYIDIARDYTWETEQEDGLIVRKEPYGVVACLTPWNYPMGQIMTKIVPALLAGMTIVLKPSQQTPLTAFHLTKAIEKAGFPKGVFNLVTGKGAEVGNELATHPGVDMISFTGSTKGGIQVYQLAAESGKRVLLEMGGKSAAILLDEEYYEQAVKNVLSTVYNNVGQTCSAWTRILVPEEDKEKVEELIKEQTEKYNFDNPWEGKYNIGPLANRKQYDKVTDYISKGVEEGAELLIGKEYDGFDGDYRVGPTVFTNVKNDMKIAQEEIFGPVLCLITYKDIDEAIEIANDSMYGLSGAVYGEKEKALDVARRMKTGEVKINGAVADKMAPFGGYKYSGIGREKGLYGFDEYLQVKAIHCK